MGRVNGVRRGAASGRAGARGPVRLVAVAAALATAAVLPGGAALAAGARPEYAFAGDALPVEGAGDPADAVALEPGAVYRSSLPPGGPVHYRLDLDASSTAYVSVTAVPAPGTEGAAADGIRVSLQDAAGGSCSSVSATFGAARSPRPVTALALREISSGRSRCQDAGTYDLVVERSRTQDPPPDAWDLELTTATEPPLRQDGPAETPGAWDSSSPEPLAGEPVNRPGGAGFAEATPLGQGVWRDGVRPGQTLFYAVPLDWGRRLSATAELDATDGGTGFATSALRLALHDPVRGEVDAAARSYAGRRISVGLAALPPVDHANRHAGGRTASAMRIAGRYYLVVHLAAQVAEDFGEGPFTVTLRVRVDGAARSGPEYAGEPVPPGAFEVSAGDRPAAGAGDPGGDPVMRAVAAGGLATGTALLLALGVWTAVARRGGSVRT
ncbi:hypothetical protein [Streptomyces tagetis]|uniref:Uncharacterized protein n=1 Tax=Streptomyces tagetis TaxID=2820809 RepID=A0A941B2X2_9ACTN|nr:hypothetical protein [Streptomyces sp. RG38]MBQ0827637.1 hypothetical protein [Streptomyces sp. RG38]